MVLRSVHIQGIKVCEGYEALGYEAVGPIALLGYWIRGARVNCVIAV